MPYLVKWGLFNPWFCMPLNGTKAVEADVIAEAKAFLSIDFQACPDAYIKDRLFGGLECGDVPNQQVHAVLFGAGYSFLDAKMGIYWALTPERRREVWLDIAKQNPGGKFYPGALFTEDFPLELLDEEEKFIEIKEEDDVV